MSKSKISIRLKRTKRYHYTMYEIVSLKTRTATRTKIIEKLGMLYFTYNQRLFFANMSRLSYWLLKGAAIKGVAKKLIFSLY